MTVELTLANGLARVTINRPDRLNAVDSSTSDALERIWLKIEQDASIRCAVLTGAGEKAFSAGADMKSDTGMSGVDYWAHANPNGFGGISMRQTMTKPVIARVNGLALGGGMEMVLGCDIVIAAEHATFGLPEARVGRLPLDGGMVMLQRLIPAKIATGLMMTGRRLSSSEALGYGLVNQVVAYDQLDSVVDEWVADVVACAPLSLAAIKQTLQGTGHLPPAQAYAMGLPALIKALSSEDADEGVSAFREKRTPVWQGK